jgi:DNA-binding NtrC family response regulator
MPEDLPARIRGESEGGDAVPNRPILPLKKALEEPEKRILERALTFTGGNRQRTAALLEINRTTLFNKMKKYQLLDRY